MPVNEENMQCLLYCAENILECDIKGFSSFKNLSLFFKIINQPSLKLDIDNLIEKLSDIFMTSIEDVLDLGNKDNLSDFELSKILLLCIVVNILIGDEDDNNTSTNLIKLSDNIPKHFQKNVSVMFRPFIAKHNEKVSITEEDVESALMVNDKENQTSYFSPIRERHLSHLDNDRFITAHKKKVHQEMKASQSYEIFPNVNDRNNSFSSLSPPSSANLVNHVKSPTFQGKSLMKTNRELEKNVKQLEHQLFLNTSVETEMDRTLQGWIQKYRTLEKEMRQLKSEIHSKDDLLMEKREEIERLQHLTYQNKRLEEKLKDWQDKSNEIQTLSSQLESKCEENKLLKIENRESSHFKALAIDRRVKIENLMVDINNYKTMVSELTETKNRLSETESQLMELQSHVQSLQQRHSNIDSLSDMSLNSSYFNPECMSAVVEMERDELKSELALLKEGTVSKDLYESVTRQLEDLNNKLCETNAKFEMINDDQKKLARLCYTLKKKKISRDINETIDEPMDDVNDRLTEEIFKDLQSIFDEMDSSVSHYQNIVFQLTNERKLLGDELENVLDKEKRIHSQMNHFNMKIDQYERLVENIKRFLLDDNDGEGEDYGIDRSVEEKDIESLGKWIDEKLREQRRHRDNKIEKLTAQMITIGKMFTDSVSELKIDLENLRNSARIQSQLIQNETIRDFRGKLVEIDCLERELEKIKMETGELNFRYQETVDQYEHNIELMKLKFESQSQQQQVTINRLSEAKNELLEKHNCDRLAIESAMELKLDKMKRDHEHQLFIKERELSHEKLIAKELNDRLLTIEREAGGYDEILNDLQSKLHKSEKSISQLQSTIELNAIDWERNKAEQIQDLDQQIVSCEEKIDTLTAELKTSYKINAKILEQLEETSGKLCRQNDEMVMKESESQKYQETISNIKEELVCVREELDKKSRYLNEKILELAGEKERVSGLELLLEEMRKNQSDQKARNDYLMEIDGLYQKLIIDHNELVKEFEKSKVKFEESNRSAAQEIQKMTSKIDLMKEKQSFEEIDKRLKETVIGTLESQYRTIEEQLNEIEAEKSLLAQHLLERSTEMESLRDQLSLQKEINSEKESCLSEQVLKISILEETIDENRKTVETLNQSIRAMQIDIDRSVKIIGEKDGEICVGRQKIDEMKLKIDDFQISIEKLNSVIGSLEHVNRCKQVEIDKIEKEKTNQLESMQTIVDDKIDNLKLLHSQIDNLINEKESKVQELTKAKEEFNIKIQSLQSIIQDEMRNYQKVSEEWKVVEQESLQFKEKYNSLLKKSHDNEVHLQGTIKKLSDKIDRVEEERDDQVHEMEKAFNAKIFDLQTNLDEKMHEMESMKKEIVENRKQNKTIRVNFELERERLQKANVARENQFAQEKALLVGNLEREKLEKTQCKEQCEEKIGQLENMMKIDREQMESDLRDSKNDWRKLNEKLKETQIALFRTGEQLNQKEQEFEMEKSHLHKRINELEPLEAKIELLESTSRRLVLRLNELEDSENMKEIAHLRSEVKSRAASAAGLEREVQELIAKNKALEQRNRDLIDDNKASLRKKNEMSEKINNLHDQIRNLQSLDQRRLDKIQNIETEINSIKTENESLKTRYLKLREISESHLEKVLQTHEETVKNYIERLGSLTKDVEKFQEQIQLLTVKKNMLSEDNCTLKRNVAELNSKFNNLRTVLREQTQNEMRQMSEKYNENSRYARMSQWVVNRPNFNRQLPPVEYLQPDSASALGLNNPTSKMLFESFVFSPYTCEDESNILLHKDIESKPNQSSLKNPIAVGYDTNRRLDADENFHQIITPLKKRKDGIRYQLTSKIRRSLHLETSSNNNQNRSKNPSTSSSMTSTAPLSKKLATGSGSGDREGFSSEHVSSETGNIRAGLVVGHGDFGHHHQSGISQQSTLMKQEPSLIGSKQPTNPKPPVIPRKKLASKLESSQLMNVIDLDELRQRIDRKYFINNPSRKRKQKDKDNDDEKGGEEEILPFGSQSTTVDDVRSVSNVKTVTNGPTPAESICSLFQDNGITNQKEDSINYRQTPSGSVCGGLRLDTDVKAFRSLDSTPAFNHKTKSTTPKPSSIIRRLIRKSKGKTPKRKQQQHDSSSLEKLV